MSTYRLFLAAFLSLAAFSTVAGAPIPQVCAKATLGPAARATVASPIVPDPFPWSRHLQQDSQGYYYQPTGLCEDYPREARNQARLDADFAIIHATGAKLLRVGISWQDVERRPGVYRWTFWDDLVQTAVRNRIALIPYVCYTPSWAASSQDEFYRQPPADMKTFEDFMRTISSRYRGKVRSWELWNEPDNRDFWLGTADQYAQLVRVGARGVRDGDPGALVVLGGLSGQLGFLRTLVSDDKLLGNVDVVNIHDYFETWNDYRIEHTTRYIGEVAATVAQTGHPIDLWMAEFGYSDLIPGSGSGIYDFPYQHTPAYQAVALFRSHILALATGKLSLTAWYRINDLPPSVDVIGDQNNRYLGLIDTSGQKKPAFYALRFYNQLFDQPSRCIDSRVTIARPAASQSVVHVFELKDKTIIVVGWLRSALPGDILPGSADERRETVSIRLPVGRGVNMQCFDATGREVAPATLKGGLLSGIVLSGDGLFVARIGKRSVGEGTEIP